MIPVIVFAYNRPDLFARLLDSLRGEAVPLLYIFSDGPKTEAEADRVDSVRKLIEQIDWCPKRVSTRTNNFGLGRSVKAGVTAVLQEWDAAIVFEDDLMCVRGTYRYMAAALENYRTDTRVMSVTGWTHPRVIPAGLGSQPYFDGKAECWAWGTWTRAWEGMEMPALDVMEACRARGLDVERFGSDMPKMAGEAAARNLWAVGWWYLHLLRGGLCLRPPRSLVEHLGWDGRGTTITPDMMGWLNPPLPPAPPLPTVWPEPIEHPDCAELWRVAIGDPPRTVG